MPESSPKPSSLSPAASSSAHGGIAPSPFAIPFPPVPPISDVETRVYASNARYKNRDDLLLVSLKGNSTCAGVFTASSAAAAPVLWSQRALRKTNKTRAILVNAGQANALTGRQGENIVARTRDQLATLMGIAPEQVLLASTGVIGEPPDLPAIETALPPLLASPPCDWQRAARAFSTTDSFPKGASEVTEIDGVPITLAGIAKGAGMIAPDMVAPDMATMLAIVATDATLPAPLLQELLQNATARTFNAVTIDGDTSTNDTVFAVASGAQDHKPVVSLDARHAEAFTAAFARVLRSLARQIAMDGEGIGKFITLWTKGARDEEEGRKVGRSVLSSPLVKIALGYGDANWGRIAMAIGKTGVPVRWNKASIAFREHAEHEHAEHEHAEPEHAEHEHAEHVVFAQGEPVATTPTTAAALARAMSKQRLTLTIDLGLGDAPPVETWGCDLTHEYLRLNGDYRS